jgi:hypothetical protein
MHILKVPQVCFTTRYESDLDVTELVRLHQRLLVRQTERLGFLELTDVVQQPPGRRHEVPRSGVDYPDLVDVLAHKHGRVGLEQALFHPRVLLHIVIIRQENQFLNVEILHVRPRVIRHIPLDGDACSSCVFI